MQVIRYVTELSGTVAPLSNKNYPWVAGKKNIDLPFLIAFFHCYYAIFMQCTRFLFAPLTSAPFVQFRTYSIRLPLFTP